MSNESNAALIARLRRKLAKTRHLLAQQKRCTQEALYFHYFETAPRTSPLESPEAFAVRMSLHREFFHRSSETMTGSRLPNVNPWEE